jgi:hypothetical protein
MEGGFMPYYKCFPNLLTSLFQLGSVRESIFRTFRLCGFIYSPKFRSGAVSVPSYQDWYFGGLVLLSAARLEVFFPPTQDIFGFFRKDAVFPLFFIL